MTKLTLRRLACFALLAAVADTLRKIIARYLLSRRFVRLLAAVPAPAVPHHPVLGTTPEYLKNRRRTQDWRNECCNGRPATRVLFPIFFRSHAIWLTDPSLVKHILKDRFDNYDKAEKEDDFVFYSLNELIGKGIFTATHGPKARDGGKLWSAHRKCASTIFSRKNFNDNMGRVFQAKGLELRRVLAKKIAHAVDGDGSGAIDMQRMFFAFTMDSVMAIFFGRSSNTMDGAHDAVGTNFDEAHRHMMEHLESSFVVMSLAELAPFFLGGAKGLLINLQRWLNSHSQKFRQCIARMDAKIFEIINERRKDPNLEECSDLLALFMKSKDPNTGQPFTDADLRNIVLNFVIAGRDTTACTLTWLFYELAINPEVQERLAAEVSEAFSKDSVPTVQDMARLPYLNGAVYEALRLHPPVPVDFKQSVEDDIWPDGTWVPKGTRVWFMPYSMGRDSKRYPDPLKFNPDRWIPFTEPQSYDFPQFQAGPRICLGKEMALYEAKLLTVLLLQEFRFSLKEGEAEKITYGNGVTMSLCNSKQQDSHNLWMHVSHRT